jgi:hypothetical protein
LKKNVEPPKSELTEAQQIADEKAEIAAVKSRT